MPLRRTCLCTLMFLTALIRHDTTVTEGAVVMCDVFYSERRHNWRTVSEKCRHTKEDEGFLFHDRDGTLNPILPSEDIINDQRGCE